MIDLDQDERAGLSFSLNYLGQIGLYAAVDGQWQGCESKEAVPLLKWSHVAGTFDPETGFAIYVNGQLAAEKPAKQKSAEGFDLFIGMAHRKQFPALTEREPSKKLLSNMVFDGLIDEAGIDNRALTADEIKTSFTVNAPGNPQPLQYRVLPSGPPGPRAFGTFYTRLTYCPEWDRIWRVGDFPDELNSLLLVAFVVPAAGVAWGSCENEYGRRGTSGWGA